MRTKPTIKKVVDTNYLRHLDLKSYLEKSEKNFAVITDYAAMEAYKGDALISIFKSMDILSQFPRQVIILKSTSVVCGLKPRSKGLQNRLIDEGQTKDFRIYCDQLRAAQNGDLRYHESILAHGKAATLHMEKMLADAQDLLTTFKEISDIYSRAELSELKAGKIYNFDIVDKTIRIVLSLSGFLFQKHPNVKQLPKFEEVKNTFVFRYSLCTLILILRWIRHGHANQIKPEKLRNDLVDLNFASYSLYFDGLLTHEKKLNEIYQESKMWLSFFDRHSV